MSSRRVDHTRHRFAPDQPDATLLGQIVDYYREALSADAGAMAHLRSQGLNDNAIMTLRLGLCDRTLGLHMPEANRKAGASLRDQLQRLGVLRSTGHEHLRGCITLPIVDADGRVTDVLGFRLSGRRGDVYPSLSLSGVIDAEHQARALNDWCVTEQPPIAVVEQPAPAAAPLAVSPPAPGSHPVAPPPAITKSASRLDIDEADGEVRVRLEDRHWRIRGLERNLGHNRLKVTLMVSRTTPDSAERFHVDSIEMYQARQRASFTRQAAIELGIEEGKLKHDVGLLLMELEQLQADRIRGATTPKEAVAMTDTEHAAALELLRDARLLDRVTEDFARCGVVGEQVNKQVAFLAAISRKLRDPLAIVVQSSSAAGKTSLMDAVLDFVPEEDRIAFSAMTGQSLYYLGQSDLAHKVLAVAEEQGVQHATYALKLLQSQGELTIASTGKDSVTGRLVTQTYKVKGPVSIFMTTTAIDVDEELLNRCIVLSVDEDRDQTRAIHAEQRHRQTLAGLVETEERRAIRQLHRNAQRLLEPLEVVNPFADRLTFADHQTRTRRDHMKYLGLIKAVTLLHQHQRDIRQAHVAGQPVRYIEVTEQDIVIANRLAHSVLGRSLDELPTQTRRLLTELHQLLTKEAASQRIALSEIRFQRRAVREQLSWGDTQIKVHLRRLVEMEYVLAHRSRDQRGLVYELLYDGQGVEGQPFLTGLIEASAK
jgi:hypothetical protein